MAILKYIGRRLLVLIPVLLGISLAAFLLGRIAPGDPVDDALFRIGIEFPTEEDRADMRAELGLDRPLPVQYLDWLGDALRGDLGRSYIGNKDIAQELMTRLPITLKVSLAAMLAAVVFGVGGGVLMAACHGTWLDTVLKGLSTLLLSVPGFWLALFLITVFAEWLHLLPTSGLDRGLASLVLPAVALSAANVGSTSRFTRGNILAQLGEQYIVVANAKGLSQRAVMVGHAFRNSLVPIITLIGNYFGGILGGSTIIENIFAIPGLGSYVLSAIQNREITRVGSTKARRLDIRFLSLTNSNLREKVAAGTFRSDLFYRLNVIPIQIPPLRARPEDIPELVEHFLEIYRRKYQRSITLTPKSMDILTRYRWPGNVRELENALEYLALCCPEGDVVQESVVLDLLRQDTVDEALQPVSTLGDAVSHYEKTLIEQALRNTNSMRSAAEALGVNVSTISRKIKQYNIHLP